MKRPAAAVVVASSLAACLSIQPFQGQLLLKYSDDDGGATVTAPDFFTLHFASGASFHFPDQLTIGSSGNLLGHDGMARCFDESGTGFSLYPTPRISADIPTKPVQNQLVPLMKGPAVVQVRLDWATRLDCSQTRAPGGHSTFTVFPDGRIVRHDTLSDPSQDQIFSNACKCQSYPDPTNTTPDEFIIESYWSFARSFGSLHTVSPPDGTASQPEALPDAGIPPQGADSICLDAGTYQLTSFQPPSDDLQKPHNNILSTKNLIVHRNQQRIGPSDLEELSWDIYSALFVEKDGCTRAAQHVKDYYRPPTLLVNQRAGTASPLDGIYEFYDGGMGSGQAPGFDVSGDTTTLSLPPPLPDGTKPAPLTGGFAVWLRFPQTITVTVPVATRAAATGTWYVPQRVDDHDWIIWFRDPLQNSDDVITIRPD